MNYVISFDLPFSRFNFYIGLIKPKFNQLYVLGLCFLPIFSLMPFNPLNRAQTTNPPVVAPAWTGLSDSFHFVEPCRVFVFRSVIVSDIKTVER